ncbi:hypothetical protein [Halobaculum lipolyticum]|uniref:Uncharacterized protein n=1 Tax=Halobaculum lipolyticum TaxID=3032001 RepID=A0ABD5WBL0_9EURY|nr:hypothetical protein [Halobaculum sp. DT31]
MAGSEDILVSNASLVSALAGVVAVFFPLLYLDSGAAIMVGVFAAMAVWVAAAAAGEDSIAAESVPQKRA